MFNARMIVCWLRQLWNLLRTGEPISGHAWALQSKERDEPCCTQRFRCDTCKTEFIGWEPCICKARRRAAGELK